jgi:hypothetical protein
MILAASMVDSASLVSGFVMLPGVEYAVDDYAEETIEAVRADQRASGGPGNAWIGRAGFTVRMGHGSGCWGNACGDIVDTPDWRRTLPMIRIRRGSKVNFRLQFDPTRLTLKARGYVRRLHHPDRRSHVRVWGSGGLVTLTAYAPQGHKSWHTRLRFRG